MRKYMQLTFVLSAFFAAVLVTRLGSGNEAPPEFADVGPLSPTPSTAAEPPSFTPIVVVTTPTPVVIPDVTAEPTAYVSKLPTAVPTIPAPTRTPFPTTTPVPNATPGPYIDGVYQSKEVDAHYGIVQIEVVIANGNIADVRFLSYPDGNPTSLGINQKAAPRLRAQVLKNQAAKVKIISGASVTCCSFLYALNGVLARAKGA
ncbi:MAG: hypothetical protein FJ319_09925 [SAR202 cluster bacterium]|nr:hypothetical protein [SAR202 cluster bacterium]